MLRLLRAIAVLLMVVTLVLGFAAGQTLAGESSGTALTMDDINGVMKQAGEKARTLPPPDSDQATAATEQAGRLMEQFNTPAHQAKIHGEQQRLRETVFNDTGNRNASPGESHASQEGTPDRERLYLFVSSSVPLATLRTYAATIDRAKARQVTMVLRGFVGGMKKAGPTLTFIGKVLKKDPACDLTKGKCDMFQADVQVDPERFQSLHVNEVPALAYVQVGQDGDETGEPLIVSGDASLDALLARIDREAKSPGLQRLIAAISGSKEQGGYQ